MTDLIVPDVLPWAQFTGDGEQTVFNLPFPAVAASDLKLRFGDGDAATAYTVTDLGVTAGCTVTFDTAPPDGTRITAWRDAPLARASDFTPGGDFRALAINAELDGLWLAVQQVEARGLEAIRRDPTDLEVSMLLPAAAARAGKFLAFDDDGKPIAADVEGFEPSIYAAAAQDSANAAAASATTAGGHAANAAASASSAAASEANALAAAAALDLPVPEAGDEGKYLAVNGTADAFELIAGGGGGSGGGIVGEIRMWSGSAAPSGWALCDGAAVSRTTYSALYAVTGDAFGVGDGSTTFNLPDLRGRAPIGAGSGPSLTTRALGAKVGGETHQLTTAEMPAHTHAAGSLSAASGGSASADVTLQRATGSGGSSNNKLNNGDGSADEVFEDAVAIPAHTHTISGTTGSAGTGNAHTIMGPSQAVNFIVHHGVTS